LAEAETDTDALTLELDTASPQFPYKGLHPVPQYASFAPQKPYCEQHSAFAPSSVKPLQVFAAPMPQVPSVEVVKKMVGRGAAEVVLAITGGTTDGWGPHFPKRGLHPVPQYASVRPHQPEGEQHSPRPSGPTKPMQDWTEVLPHMPSIDVGPVGVGTGMEDEGVGLGLTPGVESRYQFSTGSFMHSPTVTAVQPFL
jgi:hypothetical protein